ncbi:substrate-binding periplasmic protein [Colwellia sp. MEBiC06753]
MKHWLAIIVSWLLLALCIARAEQLPTTLSFCFEEWTPYAFTDESGKATGSSVNQIEKALAKQGYKARFIERPYHRCIEMVNNQLVDFVLYVDESDGLQMIGRPIANWTLTFVVPKSSSISTNEIIQRAKSKLLIGRNYIYPEPVRKLLKRKNLDILTASYSTSTADEVKRLFEIVTSRRVDAMLIDKTWAEMIIQQYGFEVKVLPDVIHEEPQYIGYHVKNQTKAHQLMLALAVQ